MYYTEQSYRFFWKKTTRNLHMKKDKLKKSCLLQVLSKFCCLPFWAAVVNTFPFKQEENNKPDAFDKAFRFPLSTHRSNFPKIRSWILSHRRYWILLLHPAPFWSLLTIKHNLRASSLPLAIMAGNTLTQK